MEENKEQVKKEKLPVPFVQDVVVRQARQYAEVMELPKEAIPSILSSVLAHQGLERLIRKQRRLKPEERKRLISSKDPVSDAQLKMADEFVDANKVPYSTIYLTRDGNIAIRARGWEMKGQSDARIFREWEESPIEMVSLDDGNLLFNVNVVAVFWNGQRFPASGSADVYEVQSRRTSTVPSPAFVRMIAETRAKTRALRSAIGLPYDIAEDMEAVEAERVVLEVPREAAPTVPTNKAQLVSLARGKYGLNLKELLEKLEVSSLDEVEDIGEAWAKLEEE